MRGRHFSTILEECLQRLDRGESLPDLLAENPGLVEQLKPLLLVAMASRSFPVPVPSQTAQRLGRNQMLAEMNALEIKKAFRKKPTIPAASRVLGGLVRAARSRGLTQMAFSYRLAMVVLVLALSGGYFTINASASSQPGDLLYSLRLGLLRAGQALSIVHEEPRGEGDQPLQVPPDPWEFSGFFLALDDLFGDYPDLGSGSPDTTTHGFVFTVDSTDQDSDSPDDLKEEAKDLIELEKDLREEEKDLKEDEKEAEEDLKEEEKEAEEDLKDQEKDLKDEEKEAEKGDKLENSEDRNPKAKDY